MSEEKEVYGWVPGYEIPPYVVFEGRFEDPKRVRATEVISMRFNGDGDPAAVIRFAHLN